MSETKYEWKVMSEWLNENQSPQDCSGPGIPRMPSDDGWELVGGALRRALRTEPD